MLAAMPVALVKSSCGVLARELKTISAGDSYSSEQLDRSERRIQSPNHVFAGF
jgi:hypothetical protein